MEVRAKKNPRRRIRNRMGRRGEAKGHGKNGGYERREEGGREGEREAIELLNKWNLSTLCCDPMQAGSSCVEQHERRFLGLCLGLWVFRST